MKMKKFLTYMINLVEGAHKERILTWHEYYLTETPVAALFAFRRSKWWYFFFSGLNFCLNLVLPKKLAELIWEMYGRMLYFIWYFSWYVFFVVFFSFFPLQGVKEYKLVTRLDSNVFSRIDTILWSLTYVYGLRDSTVTRFLTYPRALLLRLLIRFVGVYLYMIFFDVSLIGLFKAVLVYFVLMVVQFWILERAFRPVTTKVHRAEFKKNVKDHLVWYERFDGFDYDRYASVFDLERALNLILLPPFQLEQDLCIDLAKDKDKWYYLETVLRNISGRSFVYRKFGLPVKIMFDMYRRHRGWVFKDTPPSWLKLRDSTRTDQQPKRNNGWGCGCSSWGYIYDGGDWETEYWDNYWDIWKQNLDQSR